MSGLKTTVGKKLSKFSQQAQTKFVDDELLQSSKKAATISSTSSKPIFPEFSGPFAHIQERLHFLRQSSQNPPMYLTETTRDMNEASVQMNAEVDRMKRDGTANLSILNTIHKQEETIGYRILKMLREHQADGILEAAETAVNAIKNVQLTMEQLNDMLSKTQPAKIDTIQRLENIKKNMNLSAVMTQTVCEVETGERLLEIVNNIINVNNNTVMRLQKIKPQSETESILIEGLERNNVELSDSVQVEANKLSIALDNRSNTNLPEIMYDVSLTVDELLSLSFSKDVSLNQNAPETNATRKAILIEDERNILLENINTESYEIGKRVESIYKTALSSQLVSRFLKADEIDESDDIIDVENIDLGFADTLEESVIKSRREKALIKIPDNEENLFNISNSLINDLEKSIEFIEREMIPDLTEKQSESSDSQEKKVINEAIEISKKNVVILEAQLDNLLTVKDSLDKTTVDLNQKHNW
jgi:hypothetical protein